MLRLDRVMRPWKEAGALGATGSGKTLLRKLKVPPQDGSQMELSLSA